MIFGVLIIQWIAIQTLGCALEGCEPDLKDHVEIVDGSLADCNGRLGVHVSVFNLAQVLIKVDEAA